MAGDIRWVALVVEARLVRPPCVTPRWWHGGGGLTVRNKVTGFCEGRLNFIASDRVPLNCGVAQVYDCHLAVRLGVTNSNKIKIVTTSPTPR